MLQLTDIDEDSRADERFDDWVGIAKGAFCPVVFERLGDWLAPGSVSQYRIGPLTVSRLVAAPSAIRRTPANVADADPDIVALAVQLEGSSVLSQDDRAVTLVDGEMALYHTSRPFRIASDRPFEMTIFETPRRILSARPGWACPPTAQKIEGPVARELVAPFLFRLAGGLDDGSVAESDTDVGESALSLLRALSTDVEHSMSAMPRTTASLAASCKAYIEMNLGERDLRPETIAQAHFISTRYLQKLFSAQQITVTDWIRERRLAACHRDLRDPARADDTILGIATRWGFTNPAHFSRIFRSAYGYSPSALRRTYLSLRPD